MGRYGEAEKQFEKSAIKSKGKEKIESHCFFARALYYSNCNDGQLSRECNHKQILKEFKKAMGLAYSYCQRMKDNSLLLE